MICVDECYRENTIFRDTENKLFSVELHHMVASEAAQEVYEYARRGRLEELMEVITTVHPDAYVAYDGSTAFIMACKRGDRSICEVLMKHGADISLRTEEGSTALHLAACSGSGRLVELLLAHRIVDLNETNEDGFTPLDLAKYYNHEEVVSVLVSHGAVASGLITPDAGEVEAGPSEKWGYGVFDQ